MLELEHRDGRIFLRLRVSPKSKRDRIAGEHGGALKLYVKDPPEKGRANEGVLRVLADALGIAPREIELVSGHTSQDKRVAISGIDEVTLRDRLEQTT
ncbi:MAG: DUF167 domain-containing protein [Planctomycetes bacterium]|nr:DUF167 domain-containing protein [Planctomycetota bacterium]MCB9934800.1 DUF167 domain-containing protein [Planctomycetota bacterium]